MKLITKLFICVFFIACNSQNESNNNSYSQKVSHTPQTTEVDTIILRRSTFTKELVSNGKLEAYQKARLKFDAGGQIASIPVANGEFIKKGALIARLDTRHFKTALTKTESRLEQARLDLWDLLIGQGHNPRDTASIPDEVMEVARIKSGFESALASLKEARLNLANASLRAPFSGVLANIEHKPYEYVSAGEDFCTLIDKQNFDVDFSILETELGDVQEGTPVRIKPLAGGNYQGKIALINPVVNHNGLIKVTARVPNPNGNLMDGMNAKVFIQNPVPAQLVIPKSALVLRQNKEVVFTVHKDTIAMWNYVTSELENSNSYTITDGLRVGDTVIVSNNINLAHEASIQIK